MFAFLLTKEMVPLNEEIIMRHLNFIVHKRGKSYEKERCSIPR
jgi:hypothetical protein|uniref:Uncharacterized protein n=1 Tax=Aeromonas caviae TaxID=648 RepID=A0A9Q7WBX7_AERCA|nr:Uncharacterised protein [Aeromonas caviae]